MSTGDIMPSTETPPEPVTQPNLPATSDSVALPLPGNFGTGSKSGVLHQNVESQKSLRHLSPVVRDRFAGRGQALASWTGSNGWRYTVFGCRGSSGK